ncbi:MAG: DUF1616 domain-containing protein [Chloroflexota bacterium]
MFRKYVDLIAYMVAALTAIIVLTLELPSQPVMAILLVFILPGYAMQSLIYDEPGEFARLLLTIGISVTLTIVLGFLIHLSPYDIDRQSWLVSLSGVTVLLGLAATVRRMVGEYPFRKSGRLTVQLFANLWIPVIAIGVLLYISYQFAISQPEVPFTSFALLAVEDGALEVSVNNYEQEPVDYRIEVVSEDGQVIFRETTGTLSHTSSMSYTFDIPAAIETERVTANLFRDGELYRSVWVDF